jgi:hypothetical protein
MSNEKVSAAIHRWWPMAVAAAVSLLAFGDVRTDLVYLKHAQAQQSNDHDAIVRIDQKVNNIEGDITEMKQDIKDIAQAVK